MVELLKVPYLGTAEEDVVVAKWLVAAGAPVRRGEAVAVVETLKAAFEVEAERDGVLVRTLVDEGARVSVQAPLAVVAAAGEAPDDGAIDALLADAALGATPVTSAPAPATPRTAAARAPGAEPEASPAARAKARELCIDLAQVRGTGPGGLIRVEDVEMAVALAADGNGGGTADARADGELDPEFVARLRHEADTFAALSSPLKIAIYRRFGARIGDDVEIGPGAWLRARRIVVGDGSRFGADTTIEADELVTGRLAQFAARCKVRCRRIRLGDNAFFAPDVEIGGGGAMDPEAELIVGSHGFVGEHVHLNPCRRLEIGDEVVVSRSAIVMTHSFGGSILKGYPNRFAPVRIGHGCQVGISAMLFPGVEMGDGSILLSNSTLVTSIPPGRMFGGVPATDQRAAAHPPTAAGLLALAADLVRELARQLELRGRDVELLDRHGALQLTVTADGRAHRLVYGTTPPPLGGDLPCEDIWVAPGIDDATFAAAPAERTVFDLGAPRLRGPSGPLADALREFLRKRGVRLEPRTWTYPGGWL
ncbi:MAG: E3 binding domain-containing protein [Planctomycetes bacterium]|nr:E3 binding domain-containing protein [Planctomycetota bacterium]